MYRIAFTPEAISDLDAIRQVDARRVIAEIELQLFGAPATPTRNRKQLRPNQFHVFYDIVVSDVVVRIVAIDDFDLELARTRANPKLMKLLDAREQEPKTVDPDDVKRRFSA